MKREILWLVLPILLISCGGSKPFAESEIPASSLQPRADEIQQANTPVYWLRCAVGQTWDGTSCAGKESEVTWHGREQCPPGYRVPMARELRRFPSELFPDVTMYSCYWANDNMVSPYAQGLDQLTRRAKSVCPVEGNTEVVDTRFKPVNHVRCMRIAERDSSNTKPDEVAQPNTLLYWLRCPLRTTWNGTSCMGSMKIMPWDDAVRACPVGYRLPTREEFVSLLDCGSDVLDGEEGECSSCRSSNPCNKLFSDKSQTYWSSTVYTHEEFEDAAWSIGFSNGTVWPQRKSRKYRVLCVREE